MINIKKVEKSFFVFSRDIASEPALSPCLPKPVSLTYLSVYDSRDSASESTLSPSPLSSLTYVHRCIGYRNPNWHSLPNPVRLTNLSVYDRRDVSSVSQPQLTESDQVRETDVSKCVWQQRWLFWTRTLPVFPLLTHEPLWFWYEPLCHRWHLGVTFILTSHRIKTIPHNK